MSIRRDPVVHEPHLRPAHKPARSTAANVAELIAAASLEAFALLTWPPAALLVTAALAAAYAWQRR